MPDKNTSIESIRPSINVMSFISYREYLNQIYLQMKSRQRSYSHKKLSDDLGLGSNNSSWVIITGRKKLGPQSRQKIIEALGLKSIERQYFETLVEYNNCRKGKNKDELLDKLINLRDRSLDDPELKRNLKYFSRWYHPVIREMVGLKYFKNDAQWICQNLNDRVLPNEAEETLRLLLDLGLIKHNKMTKSYQTSGENITPDDQVDDLAMLRYHQEILSLTSNLLAQLDEEEFDINALTIRLSEKQFSRAEKILYDAFYKIFRMEEEDPTDSEKRLYQANFQLLPLTKKMGRMG